MFRFVILAAKLQQSIQTAKLFAGFFYTQGEKKQKSMAFCGGWARFWGERRKNPSHSMRAAGIDITIK
jgi:hypothetical protein